MEYYPFVPYDPIYPELFEVERKRIQSVLGDVTIEHFGSTAVEGLGGKGYIDIYVVVPKSKLESTSNLIQEKLEYEFRPNAGKTEERLFHQRKVVDENGIQRVYHLHLTYLGNKDYENDIKFRDLLRNDPQAAIKYAAIKEKASKEANKAKNKKEAKEVYMRIKEPVIREIIDKRTEENMSEYTGLEIEHISTILFDFDDVLAYPDISKCIHELLGVEEAKVEAAAKETIKEKEDESRYLPTVEKELEYMKSYYKTILKKLELDDSHLKLLMERHMKPRKKLFPGVLELLEKLKKSYELGMISNAFPSRRVNEFDRLGLTKYFKPDLIIVSAEVGYWKPDLKIFKLAIKRASVSLESIMYIDDKEKFLDAASKSGIKNLIRVSETDNSAYKTIPKATDLLNLL